MKNKKKKFTVLSLMALSSLALVACNDEGEKAPTDNDSKKDNSTANEKAKTEKAIKQAITDNIKAIETENVQDYLAGYIIEDSAMEEAKANAEEQFKLFDKTYAIDKLEISESTDKTAIVQLNYTVKNSSDEKFVDHKGVTKYTMKLVDNKWKIESYLSEMVSELDNEFKIEEAVKQAITDNIKAVEAENVQDYLNGFIIADNLIDGSKTNAELEFKKYDLKHTIDKMEIIESTDKSAVVKVTQTVNNSSNEGFKAQNSIATYNMKLVDDKWKIESIDTKVLSVDGKAVTNK